MYTQAVEFGAQIAKQTSKNGASVVEAGAQAGEMVRESIFESGVEGASVVEAGAQAGEEVREMFGKKDEGLLDKRVNKIPLSGNIYLDENGNLKLKSDNQKGAMKTLLYITELENKTPTKAHMLC